MAITKSIGRTLAQIDVAATTSVRIHEDFFNSHPCSQQLSEKVRLAQILSGYLRVAVILPQWATANREAKKCLQRPYDVSSANLFHSEPQAHVVLPLQAYRCLYPLEP